MIQVRDFFYEGACYFDVTEAKHTLGAVIVLYVLSMMFAHQTYNNTKGLPVCHVYMYQNNLR